MKRKRRYAANLLLDCGQEACVFLVIKYVHETIEECHPEGVVDSLH